MSARTHRTRSAAEPAAVFRALGDGTRLRLVQRLARSTRGQACSISSLTEGSGLTRQAVTKHLRVLEEAGIVRGVHVGRESLFVFEPAPVDAMREFLEKVSAGWDRKLERLKKLVEEGE